MVPKPILTKILFIFKKDVEVLTVYVIYERPLRLCFLRYLEESLKNLKNIDLILTSNFEVFWGWFIKNLNFFLQSSASKILKIFEMSILNLKKPQTMRLRLRILVYWGVDLLPYSVPHCLISQTYLHFQEIKFLPYW